MRKCTLFVATIIVTIAPCILSQPKIPDVNPEVSKEAKELLNEIWPKLEQEASISEEVAKEYAQVLEVLEEAAKQANDVAKTRLGTAVASRFTGEHPRVPRDVVINRVATQYVQVSTEDVQMATYISEDFDNFPVFTDQVAKTNADGLLERIGIDVGKISGKFILDFSPAEIIAMFLLCLITAKSGGG